MKLELQRKTLSYNIDGSVRGTEVTLGNVDGASYPVILPADKIELSNAELEGMALEVIYQENFPMRAEKELFESLNKKIKLIEEEALSAERLGQHKEAYLNQLVQTTQNIMGAQGTLRAVKKNNNKFTDEQLFEVVNTLSVASFQAVDLLRNVITILK